MPKMSLLPYLDLLFCFFSQYVNTSVVRPSEGADHRHGKDAVASWRIQVCYGRTVSLILVYFALGGWRCSHYGTKETIRDLSVGWKFCFLLRVYLTNLVPRDSHLPAPNPGNMVDTSLNKISRLVIAQKLQKT